MDFEAQYEQLYPPLFRYLHRLTGEADEAEDLVQEAFIRLFRHPLPDAEARPWLFTVATNLVRDGARRTKRQQRHLSAVPVSPGALPRPDEETERAGRVQRVREALDRLPLRDRQMLLMREEGFRYGEIAEAVGVAPGSVGTLLARALRKFKDAYGSDENKRPST